MDLLWATGVDPFGVASTDCLCLAETATGEDLFGVAKEMGSDGQGQLLERICLK